MADARGAATNALELLLSLPKEIQGNIVTVFELIHARKYTGPVTFNCHQGEPKTVQIPSPTIRLSDVEST